MRTIACQATVMVCETERDRCFQRIAQVTLVHFQQGFEENQTLLAIVLHQLPGEDACSANRFVERSEHQGTHTGMKLTMSRATFSQLIFDAQKTRHESVGITSDTKR